MVDVDENFRKLFLQRRPHQQNQLSWLQKIKADPPDREDGLPASVEGRNGRRACCISANLRLHDSSPNPHQFRLDNCIKTPLALTNRRGVQGDPGFAARI